MAETWVLVAAIGGFAAVLCLAAYRAFAWWLRGDEDDDED